MNFHFENVAITGLLTIVPSNELDYFEEMAEFDFPLSRSIKLAEVMGFSKHRVVEPGKTAVDLAVFGLQYLFDNHLIDRDEISSVIFVSQSPDYFIPSNSQTLHGVFNLPEDVYCLDIVQGCAGYIVGLIESFKHVSEDGKKVVLINADTLSSKVSRKDRNSWPLIGDGASITIIQSQESAADVFSIIKFNGSGRGALQIPAGGFREPSSEFSSVLEDDGTGNLRSRDNLVMDGAAVFNFVQESIPPLIEDLFTFSGSKIEDFEFFVFHQPNKFMLQKLAQKLKVPDELVLKNVVEAFGNSSGVTVPIAMTHNLAEQLSKEMLRLCLAGFGVGLTWGCMDIEIGKLDFCQAIEF